MAEIYAFLGTKKKALKSKLYNNMLESKEQGEEGGGEKKGGEGEGEEQ